MECSAIRTCMMNRKSSFVHSVVLTFPPYKQSYPKALELVASGRVDLKPLVSHRYDLEHAEEAFQTALTGKGNPIKVAINF